MELKISLCQLEVGDSKVDNIKKAVDYIEMATVEGANIVVLPEMFNCPYDNSKFIDFAEEEDTSYTLRVLSEVALKNNIYLIAGSIPEKYEEKIYNTSFIFNNRGEIISKHRKIHLFDVDIPGKIRFFESDILSAGSEITVFDTEFCKIGVAICYDMRFPELMRLMALRGAKVIIVPGAFNTVTGPLHWKNTIKMRAIDNQVFFAACSPARNKNSSYEIYGYSMVSDPWGEIICETDEKESIINCSLNLNLIEKYRRELPLIKHRREDIYSISTKCNDVY